MTGTNTRSGRRPVELTAFAADGVDAVKRFDCPPLGRVQENISWTKSDSGGNLAGRGSGQQV